MSIVTSSFILKNAQIDGRFIVREQYIDDLGNIFNYDYITGVGPSVILPKHLAQAQADSAAIGG